MNIPVKIIIIGCARSATGYTAKFFQQNGLKVGHEGEMENGQSNHFKTFDNLKRYDLVLHQTRHPLKVISSAMNGQPKIWKNVLKTVPYVYNLYLQNKLLGLIYYWIEWNREAKRKSDYSYRIEDIKKEAKKILSLAGITKKPQMYKNIEYNKHNSPFQITSRTIKEAFPLAFNDLQKEAKKYGYEL